MPKRFVRLPFSASHRRQLSGSRLEAPTFSRPNPGHRPAYKRAGAILLFAFLTFALIRAADAWAQAPAKNPTSLELYRLIDAVRSYDLAHDPLARVQAGDWLTDPRLPDVSPQAAAANLRAMAAFRDQIAGLDSTLLSETDQTNRTLLLWDLNWRLEQGRFDPDRIPFSNDSGFHTVLTYLARSAGLRSIADAEAWVARLNDGPRFLAQNVENIRRGAKDGFTQPQRTLRELIASLRAQIASEEKAAPGQSPLLAPLKELPDAIPQAERDRLMREARMAVLERVLPAYRQTLQILETEILPASRASLAARDLPDGEAYYRAQIRFHTTTNLSPDEIHAIGLQEVARIRAEMEKIIKEVGFKGSFAQFLHYLRHDKRFYARTPEDLLAKASALAKRADDAMPRLFGRLPRLPYGVRPVPAEIAPGYTTGRYFPGNAKLGIAGGYIVNTYDLRARPLYELPSLTLHEAVPGHHHQIALAQEIEGLPEFRRDLSVTAFIEGWGLYAEFLGYEINFFRDPYERFGALSYEMWRACRLVADTGIHWKRWTYEEAGRCFLENSALSSKNIATELERYIAWPGQALAYKIGELELKRLRKQAEDRLGMRFDRRRFHDAILTDGAMPLDLLAGRMTKWLDAEDKSTSNR